MDQSKAKPGTLANSFQRRLSDVIMAQLTDKYKVPTLSLTCLC